MKTNNIAINEKFVQEIWKNQQFSKELCTKNGLQISILEAGTENHELGGPDFKNAKIKIGNITYTGDIEIDSVYSDWKTHGHHLNKRYNSLILHLTLSGSNDYPYVFTEDGRKVQSIPLSGFLSENIRNQIQCAIVTERGSRQTRMSCLDVNMLVEEKEKLDYLYELGIERFNHKCAKVMERLKEIVYEKELRAGEPVIKYETDSDFHKRSFRASDFADHEIWEQLLYELLFEALGYAKNKDQMLKLAKKVPLPLIRKYKKNKKYKIYLEAVFYSAGGLVPTDFEFKDEETSEYVREIREKWNEIKHEFDTGIMDGSSWHFHMMRPQNFPTIRIAGGIQLLEKIIFENLIGRIINDFKRIFDIKNLIASLRNMLICKGEGYWQYHYTIGEKIKTEIKYFIGLSRVDELIINVILPVFSVYFEIFRKEAMVKKVQRLYMNYNQVSDNTLVHEVCVNLSLPAVWKRSVLYQGMIELFRNYCSKGRCMECKIGRVSFG